MKPAAFDYERPLSLAAAAGFLASSDGEGRLLAGGQSLGPMLNLRLATPRLLIDVTGIRELTSVEARDDAVVIGAATTHGMIEDGRVPDIGQGVLPSVAKGIAYRAVRNRGTIGGSLAHADPAADWPLALRALGADILTYRSQGGRTIGMGDFLRGAFHTALEPDEILVAIRIPRLSPDARWGWYKICRKPGEFSLATAAVLVEPGRKLRRSVLSTSHGAPLTFEGETAEDWDRALAAASPESDPLDRRMQAVALRRAWAMASA